MKTIDIKGKPYITVNERLKHFRDTFPEYSIETEIVSHTTGQIIFKATIKNPSEFILATGHAEEKADSSYINKTSYIENCETSAIGRALGMLGIGIDTSIASADEVQNAVNNQQKNSANKSVPPETKNKQTDDWQNDPEYKELVNLMTAGEIPQADIVSTMKKYHSVSYYQNIPKEHRSNFLNTIKKEIENRKKSANRKAEKDIETVPPAKILDILRLITSKKIPIKKVIEISTGIMPAANKIKNISDFTEYYNNLAELHQHNILNSVIDTVNAGDK